MNSFYDDCAQHYILRITSNWENILQLSQILMVINTANQSVVAKLGWQIVMCISYMYMDHIMHTIHVDTLMVIMNYVIN